MNETHHRLYGEFAGWFHLLTPPAEYAGEAESYLKTLAEMIGEPPRTLLELGSGGGNNAFHYKKHVSATLSDLSPRMLAISKRINPECEHIEGDMRALRLGRQFDAVLVHDAVCYITSRADLQKTFETAFVHCRPGGAAIFAPDYTRENFAERADHDGHDEPGRSIRYLEWVTDPDPGDTTYLCELAYVFHERGKPTRFEGDTHVCGLFANAEWIGGLRETGFERVEAKPGPDAESYDYTIFVGRRPTLPPLTTAW